MKEPKKKNRAGLWIGSIIVVVVAIVGIASASPTSTVPATSQPAAAVGAVTPSTQAQSTQTTATSSTNTLSNDNYYTNVNGNDVHSPAYSSNGCVAAGATAECNDGTCSFSQHHSGTCSHHGGVATWLN